MVNYKLTKFHPNLRWSCQILFWNWLIWHGMPLKSLSYIIISVLRRFFHVKHGLDGLLNFSLSFGRVMVWNLHYPKYPMVPNALSGVPLLVCPVKHRQLHKGNAIHLNNQTKHGMSHFCQWLWSTSISVASYDMHSYSGSILSSPNPQG